MQSILIVKFLLFFALISCNNPKSSKQVWPTNNFHSVKLISLTDSIYDLDLPTLRNKGLLDGSSSFINENGEPFHSYMKEYTLDAKDASELSKYFGSNSCHNLGDSMMCLPVYRDALLFFDKDTNLIAQMKICLECNQYTLNPNTNNFLCCEGQKSWKDFSNFIKNVKSE